jgi:hypothetical protein
MHIQALHAPQARTAVCAQGGQRHTFVSQHLPAHQRW